MMLSSLSQNKRANTPHNLDLRSHCCKLRTIQESSIASMTSLYTHFLKRALNGVSMETDRAGALTSKESAGMETDRAGAPSQVDDEVDDSSHRRWGPPPMYLMKIIQELADNPHLHRKFTDQMLLPTPLPRRNRPEFLRYEQYFELKYPRAFKVIAKLREAAKSSDIDCWIQTLVETESVEMRVLYGVLCLESMVYQDLEPGFQTRDIFVYLLNLTDDNDSHADGSLLYGALVEAVAERIGSECFELMSICTAACSALYIEDGLNSKKEIVDWICDHPDRDRMGGMEKLLLSFIASHLKIKCEGSTDDERKKGVVMKLILHFLYTARSNQAMLSVDNINGMKVYGEEKSIMEELVNPLFSRDWSRALAFLDDLRQYIVVR